MYSSPQKVGFNNNGKAELWPGKDVDWVCVCVCVCVCGKAELWPGKDVDWVCVCVFGLKFEADYVSCIICYQENQLRS
jgi:hypothetical protein